MADEKELVVDVPPSCQLGWLPPTSRTQWTNASGKAAAPCAMAAQHTDQGTWLQSTPIPATGERVVRLAVRGIRLDDADAGAKVAIVPNGFLAEHADEQPGESDDTWLFTSGKWKRDEEEHATDHVFDPRRNEFEIHLNHGRGDGELVVNGDSVTLLNNLPSQPLQVLAWFPNGSAALRLESKVPRWAPPVLERERAPEADRDVHQHLVGALRATTQLGYEGPINVALVGEPRVGKSSFVNAALTAMAPNRGKLLEPVERASVRGVPRTADGGRPGAPPAPHTKAVNTYALPGTRVELWDMFGLTLRDDGRPRPPGYVRYPSGLLKGQYRPGYRIDCDFDDQPEFRKQLKKGEKPRFEDHVHCALVVVSAAAVVRGDKRSVQAVKDVIKLCDGVDSSTDDGIPYLVVLTMVDLVGGAQVVRGEFAPEFAVEDVFANPGVHHAAETLSKATGCAMSKMVPVHNYAAADGVAPLSHARELPALRALTRAVELVQQKWPEKLGVPDADSDSEEITYISDDASSSDDDDY